MPKKSDQFPIVTTLTQKYLVVANAVTTFFEKISLTDLLTIFYSSFYTKGEVDNRVASNLAGTADTLSFNPGTPVTNLIYRANAGAGTYTNFKRIKTGTITTTSGSAAVVGVGTKFLTELAAGVTVYSGATLLGTVLSVTDDTHATLSAPTAAVVTGVVYNGPVVVSASDGQVDLLFNTTTGFWAKVASPQDLTNYYTKTTIDTTHDAQKNFTGAFFNKPLYEVDGSNRIFLYPTPHPTMGDGSQVFFRRSSFFGDYSCDWTKVKTDLTGVTGVTLGQTSPTGFATDCIRLDATYGIWFNPLTNVFSGGAWSKKSNLIPILTNNYGRAGDCAERFACNYALEMQYFDPQKITPGAFFVNPYYEFSGTTIYINAPSGFSIRGGAYNDFTRTWANIKADLAVGGLPAGIAVGVTSPLLKADCISIATTYCIWYNPITGTFSAGVRTKKPGYIKMIDNDNGIPTDCQEKALMYYYLLAGRTSTTAYVDTADRRLIDSIYLNTYTDAAITLEETGVGGGAIYVKSDNTGGAALYARGLVPGQINTWDDLIVRVNTTDGAGATFTPSPKGVADCLRLNHTEAFCYDYTDGKYKIVVTQNIKQYHNVLVHCENGRIGRLTRNLHVFRKSIENKMAAQIATTSSTMLSKALPIARTYSRGRFTFIHIGDIHYTSLNADANMLEMMDFSTNAMINADVKAIISSGDVCNGSGERNRATTIAEINTFTARLVASAKVTTNAIGNHDDNINYASFPSGTGAFAAALTKTEQYQYCIKPFADKWPAIQTVLNKCYHYVDFATDKIRIITLDFVDLPIVEGTTPGTLKYPGGYYYSQAQYDWLYTTLQSVPSDYVTFIVNHSPSIINNEIGSFLQGRDEIFHIINAYKNGTSYTHGYTNGTFPELNTSKVFDFTSNGVKMFGAHLSGHTHKVTFLNPASHPDQNVLVCGSLFTDLAAATVRDTTNEDLKNSFNIISVDITLRKLFVETYGAYLDASGDNTTRTKVLSF